MAPPRRLFWTDNADVITAVLSIVLALLRRDAARSLRSRAAAHTFAEAVTRGQVSPVLDTRLRFIRRLIYASILLIGIAVAAVAVHRAVQPREEHPRLGRARRRHHRLRRAPDARQRRRRDHARDHAAAARRRLGDVRGAVRRRRGRAAQLHRAAHARRRARGDPERAAGGRASCATTRSARTGSRSTCRSGSPPAPTSSGRWPCCADATGSKVSVAEVTPDGVRIADRGRSGAAARARPAAGRAARAVPRKAPFRRACSRAADKGSRPPGRISAGLHSEVRAVMESAFAA